MRTKDEDLLQEIQDYIEEYCDTNGRGPSVSEIADAVGKGKSLVFYYLSTLVEQERITRTWNLSAYPPLRQSFIGS